MSLNEDQQTALDAVLEGKTLFITGPGGVGKSFLIQHIVKELEQKGKRVAVTALTGCAALLLGHSAKTVHSWAGVGLAKDTPQVIVAGIKKYGYKAMRRWLLTHTLIIDEVSMMTPEFLEKLDMVGQLLRKNPKPFGGIQVLFVGDFFQLPPVVKSDELAAKGPGLVGTFVFESPIWAQMAPTVIHLTKIVRQSDPTFQTILMEARQGTLSKKSIEILNGRRDQSWQKDKIRPTLLFSRRAEVEMINEHNIKQLKGSKLTFEAKTIFDATIGKGMTKDSPEVQRAIAKLDRDAPYKASLELRVGAQVMLVYNMDQEEGLVNGSRGIVEGFTETFPPHPIVLFKGRSTGIPVEEVSWESDMIEGVHRSQIPLILAYAITIHRCQGATLDSALIDIGASTFEMGQAYVALSRVKSLESLYIYDLESGAIKAHPKVVEYYKTINIA